MNGTLRPHKRDSLAAFAVAFVVVVIWLCFAGLSHGGTVCNRCVNRAVTYAAPAVVQTYAPLYYAVGQRLQEQAVSTDAFRHAPEYMEYMQLKAFRDGVQTAQGLLSTAQTLAPQERPQTQQYPAGQTYDEATGQPTPTREGIMASPGYVGSLDLKTGKWNPAPGYDGPTPLPPPPAEEAEPIAPAPPQQLPPTPPQAGQSPPIVAPTAEQFAQRYPAIARNCTGCHSGELPKGDLVLNETTDLYSDEPGAKALRDTIMQKVINGHMPPKKTLDDYELSSVIGELYLEQ